MTPVLFNSKENCCACRACSNICPKGAISFNEDKYGFWFPKINESLCINCGRCRSVCNFQTDKVDFRQTPIKGYAAVFRDKKKIKNSASGGVFMAMAEWILSKGGCVFGCVWDSDMNAVYVCAETMAQVYPMQGSKYVQSNVGNSYNEVKKKLQDDRWVLFTGTPCQVAALKGFLGNKEYDKLVTLDLVCHGVPNNRFFHQYLSIIEKQFNGKVTDFHFRHKRPDWLRGCIWIKIKKGKLYITKELFHIESPYYWYFTPKNQSCRQSCAVCKYATSTRVGDMTMGDFWGYQKADIKIDYNNGLSCLLVNNEKMLPFLDELNMTLQEVSIEHIINGNAQLRQPYCKDEKWEYVMEKSARGEFDMLMEEYKTENEKIIKRSIKRSKLKRLLPFKIMNLLKK